MMGLLAEANGNLPIRQGYKPCDLRRVGFYQHHRTGEDNGDAHLKNLLLHHQVILPITKGRFDAGPWQRVFYCEFDGQRNKRVIVKVIGK